MVGVRCFIMSYDLSSYKVLSSEQVFSGKRFSVERDRITLPDGRTTVRETVVHGGAAAMLPIDSEGRLIFVRQYRHSARAMTLEIPAGTIERGEEPLACAEREIEEETSYRAGRMTLMFSMYSSIGICSEVLYIYLAEDLVKGEAHPDEDEFINIERYTLEESINKIYSGEICDSKTIAAVFAYAREHRVN
jgi:ADP-ribose pyrophosphatase